jgi:steroid 5-alpha reductase family enzyme
VATKATTKKVPTKKEQQQNILFYAVVAIFGTLWAVKMSGLTFAHSIDGVLALLALAKDPSVLSTGIPFADYVAIAFAAFGAITFPILFFVDAPYGGTYSPAWGLAIEAQWGWFVMESPAVFAFAYMFVTRPEKQPVFALTPDSTLRVVLFVLWEMHYVYRAWIYPFRQTGKDKPMSIVTTIFAFIWTSTNGWLNGLHLFHLHNHPVLGATLPSTPGFSLFWARTVIGIALFLLGMWINRQSDSILFSLRKPGDKTYKIPVGGMFKYVTKANYFGELVEWAGFAVACWNLPSLLFLVNTFANLVPRAVRDHRRNQKRFGGKYPKNRKAIIPFLL